MRHLTRQLLITMTVMAISFSFTLHPSPFTSMNAYAASKGAAPVAHWRFDEGGGGTAYDKAGSNNGALSAGAGGTNTAVGQMWTRQGKMGGALELDGTDDWLNCGNNSVFDITSEITIQGWFYLASDPNTDANNSYRQMVGKGGYSPWGLLLEESRVLSGSVYIAGVRQKTDTSYLMPIGEWVHVTYTYVGSTGNARIYVNGVLKTEQTKTTGTFDTSAGNVGISAIQQTYGWPGYIDDVRIYNYSRTADQILVDYNAGSAAHLGAGTDPNEGNPPVAYYKFDENTGTTAYDRSGNNNNGSFGGTPAWDHGKQGGCVKFPNDSDYVRMSVTAGSPLKLGASNFTIEGWVKIFQPQTYGSGIFGNYPHGGQNGDMVIGIDDSPKNLFFSHTNTAAQNQSYFYDFSPYFGSWTHIAWMKSGSTMYLYINGEQKQSWSITITFDIQFQVAGDEYYYISNTGWSPGVMTNLMVDEHKIYNYARTPAQIAYDYNKGKPVAQYRFDEGGGAISHNEYSSADTGTAPIGWWRMDEASWNGTANEVVDSSGNANHGAAAGGVTKATTTSSSKIGPYAGSFDGADDYVTRPTSANLQNNYFTIEAWVYNTRSTPQTGYGDTVFHLDDTSGGNIILARFSPQAGTQTSNKIEFAWAGGASAHGLTTAYSSNTWYHVAYVKDTVGAKIYVNGANVLSEADNTTVNYTNARNISIGQDQDGGSPSDFFQGRIDDVRIYNYARTAEQVYNDYKNTHGTLVADTKFVDGKLGKALSFDGTGDYVACGTDSTFDVTDTITIEAWFKASALGLYQRIVSKQYQTDVTTANSCYQLGVDSTNKFRWSVGGVFDYSLASPLVLQDTWYHLAGTYDRTYAKMYINGQEVWSSTSYTGAIRSNVNEPLTIGISKFGGTTGYPWQGQLDDVRIYNYTRSAGEVMQDYNAGMSSHAGASTGVADPWGGALPVGHWKLDENTGKLAYDNSGNGNNGTLKGDAAWAHGKHGTGLSLDGNGDYVDCGNNASLNITNAITIEALVFKSDYSQVTQAIVRKSSAYVVYFSDTSEGEPRGLQSYFWGLSNPRLGYSETNFVNNSWYHVAATYDGSIGKLYVNGVEVASEAKTGSIAASAVNVGIGAGTDGVFYFDGKIDDVRIYNYARTQAQIAWDYNKGKPVGCWRFDEKAAGQAVDTAAGAIKDDSGNNNGTASNTTWTYTTGKFGGALSFDGNDYVEVQNYFNLDIATLELWFKSNEWASYPILISKNAGGASGYIQYYQSQLRFYAPGNVVTVNWGNPSLSNWHHLVLVVTGTNHLAYLDGSLVGSPVASSLGLFTGNYNFQIGRYHTGSYYFSGLIDDVRIYNYARTAEHVLQDYNQGLAAKMGE